MFLTQSKPPTKNSNGTVTCHPSPDMQNDWSAAIIGILVNPLCTDNIRYLGTKEGFPPTCCPEAQKSFIPDIARKLAYVHNQKGYNQIHAYIATNLVHPGKRYDDWRTNNYSSTMDLEQLPDWKPITKDNCLCVFDLDRTLTGRQEDIGATCPYNKIVIPKIADDAYGITPNALTLSELGQKDATNKTFCKSCHKGIVSSGDGSNSQEKQKILDNLGEHNSSFMKSCPKHNNPVTSAFVLQCPEGQKQDIVAKIQKMYNNHPNVHIPDNKVYFFDDKKVNIEPFAPTSYNAQQISCSTRDLDPNNPIGLCGAAINEITNRTGVHICQ